MTDRILSSKERLDAAQRALTIVENILTIRDFETDSSARHNLAIAQSILHDLQREDLLQHETRKSLLERTAIMANPNTMRISISFQERSDYEDALKFFDMGDTQETPASPPQEHRTQRVPGCQCAGCDAISKREKKEAVSQPPTGNNYVAEDYEKFNE